jgi:hypothetical protein
MMFLRQSTAATVKLGPFLDETDGRTAETGLTLSQADIRLSKNGGDIAQSNNAAGATHDELGYYDVPLDTTDTGTLGRLKVMVHESGALPVWAEFTVLPANVYDSLIAGSDKLQADVAEWLGSAPNALQSGRVDGYLAAAGLQSDAVTEAQSGLATSSALTTLSGYVDTEVAAIYTGVQAIQAKTDALPTDPADQSAVEAAITAAQNTLAAAIAALNNLSQAQAQTAAAAALTAYDPPTRAEATADKAEVIAALPGDPPTANENADALLDRASAIDGYTVRQLLRLVGAALVGEVSGAGTTTVVFRAADDSKARITATVTADGDRSALTLDAS